MAESFILTSLSGWGKHMGFVRDFKFNGKCVFFVKHWNVLKKYVDNVLADMCLHTTKVIIDTVINV